jgi:pantoate--beta-alanine ligase
MRQGRRLADALVVSIFVNPTQFGPNEDLSKYPRDLENDMDLAREAGVDIVFTPSDADLYPDGFETYVVQTGLPDHLCGLSRPGHFRGVMTIVTKLFNIVKPHVAVFGEKDYQQVAVIRRMTRDLNFDINLVGAPTVREADGLAMSSRNKFLSESQRKTAPVLYRCLDEARRQVSEGEKDPQKIIAAGKALILAQKDTTIDYINIVDPETLKDVSSIKQPAVMALAVKVGETRLIDNLTLIPPEETGGQKE